MSIKTKKWWANHGATIAGIMVALGTAWSTIDWTTFDIKRDYMKLVCSGAIALGGYFSTFKIKGESTNGV